MIEDLALHVLAYKWDGIFEPFSHIFEIGAERYFSLTLTPVEGYALFIIRLGGYSKETTTALDIFYKDRKLIDTITQFPDVNTYFHLPNIFSNLFNATVTFKFYNYGSTSTTVCFHGVVLLFEEAKAKGFLEDVKALAEIPKDIKETNRLLEELNDILKGIIGRM